jgi:DNA polymerase-1
MAPKGGPLYNERITKKGTFMPDQEKSQQGATAPSGEKTLALIDAANLMHRAYHAMRRLEEQRAAEHLEKCRVAEERGWAPPEPPREFKSADGVPTGALMTFATMAKRAKEESGADALALVFESTTGTFRDEIFPEYKATRKETHDDVRVQMELAKKLFPMMGVPALWCEGFEADDVMCAFGKHLPPGWRLVMCSSDKDLGQAVGERVSQLNFDGWVKVGREQIEAKFGVGPELVAQALALQGDSVDNIPGVDKCGVKTAAKLLNAHGSIEGIYENLSTLTPVLRKNFEEARERMPLLLKLTLADVSMALPMTPDEIHAANRRPDWQAALDFSTELGMGKLAKRAQEGVHALAARAAKAPKA